MKPETAYTCCHRILNEVLINFHFFSDKLNDFSSRRMLDIYIIITKNVWSQYVPRHIIPDMSYAPIFFPRDGWNQLHAEVISLAHILKVVPYPGHSKKTGRPAEDKCVQEATSQIREYITFPNAFWLN